MAEAHGVSGPAQPTNMKPSLDIVVVNWNSGSQLRACIESIAAAERSALDLQRIVVVDNASGDGSADGLSFPGLNLVLIRNAENRGFGAACNQGARGTAADYLLFLNPDAVLFKDSLTVPVSFMEAPANSATGICGITLLEQTGEIARSCSRFPTTTMFLAKMVGLSQVLPASWARQRMTDWDHTTSRDVDQIMGAFFLVRRKLFEALGGFDERFFVYYEEVDLCFRAAARGFKSRFLADARAMHRGGGCSHQVKARRLTYSVRSRLKYALKHYSGPSAMLLVLSTLLIEPITRSAASLLRGSVSGCTETLSAFREIWKMTPQLLVGALRSTKAGV